MLYIKINPSDRETHCNISYHKIGMLGAPRPLKRGLTAPEMGICQVWRTVGLLYIKIPEIGKLIATHLIIRFLCQGPPRPFKRSLRAPGGPWNVNLSSLKDCWHVIYLAYWALCTHFLWLLSDMLKRNTVGESHLKRTIHAFSADERNSLSRCRTVMLVASNLINNMPTILQTWQIYFFSAPQVAWGALIHQSYDKMFCNEFSYHWDQFWYITCQ